MTNTLRAQIINGAANRLSPNFLEQNDIEGFMSVVYEYVGDNGLEAKLPQDSNEAMDFLYLAAEEVRALYMEKPLAA